MMKKGVMTVYFSLVFMLVMSFLLVLLESDRLYILRTEGERYADMAAEMVFAGYIQPLADYYSLFGVNHGEKNSQLEKFDDYLKLNITGEGKTKRLFQMAGAIEKVEVDEWTGFKDNDWKALMEQVKLYEEARTIQRGSEEVSRFFSDLSGMDTDEPVGDYCRQLESKGERMEAEEQEANKKDDGNTPKDTEIQMEDPRGGITRWLKGGLLELVMGNQAVSKQKISTARCSWQTSEEKKSNVIVRFDRYKEVAEAVKGQNLLSQIQAGVKNQSDQMILNMYIYDQFKTLRNSRPSGRSKDTALNYEIEYIAFGHASDRENLESAVTACFTLRTILNLAYLYLSPDKDADLQRVVQGLSAAGMIPVAGEVLKLLLMICWASAEAAVDCAGLAEGGKVPLMKDRNTWNMSVEQLLHAAAGGGKAFEYFKSGTKGWDYHQYLMLFLMLTPTEKKIIRMTQLIENNVWLMKGYENFQLKNCAVKASFSGKIDVTPFFWKYPQKIQYRFHTEYAY